MLVGGEASPRRPEDPWLTGRPSMSDRHPDELCQSETACLGLHTYYFGGDASPPIDACQAIGLSTSSLALACSSAEMHLRGGQMPNSVAEMYLRRLIAKQ